MWSCCEASEERPAAARHFSWGCSTAYTSSSMRILSVLADELGFKHMRDSHSRRDVVLLLVSRFIRMAGYVQNLVQRLHLADQYMPADLEPLRPF